MKTKDEQGFDVSELTGIAGDTGRAKLMDAQFAGPANISEDWTDQGFSQRGTPRKLGEQYFVPEREREAIARKVDELPFEEFTAPFYDSYDEMYPEKYDELQNKLLNQQLSIDDKLRLIGVQ